VVSYSVPPLVDGIPATARPTLMVSSSVRSCDGGTRCGDLAVALPLSSGRTAIILIDITGHGAGRAALSSALTDEIVTALVHDESPSAALDRADQLLRTVDDETPYAVAFAALVHPVLRTVVYASAGHDVAFTLADDGSIRHLMPTAPMLGIPLANHACDAAFTLDATETLVIVTDGISDSHRAGSDDFFGATRTALAVTRSHINDTDPSKAILEAARAHEGGVQFDDAAALVVRLQPANRQLSPTQKPVRALDSHHRSVRMRTMPTVAYDSCNTRPQLYARIRQMTLRNRCRRRTYLL
jgi:serine phosphatase RsbU (regulator of sigma subunit)